MNSNTDYVKYLTEKSNYIDSILPCAIDCATDAPNEIKEPMKYSLLAGGKRLRPVILREAARIFGREDKSVDVLAQAIEMIHTSSLIHDDLPAMDNDDYRRGRKTCHVVYGEAIAILAGDALLNYANEIMINEALITGDMNILKAAEVISRATGLKNMIGGQTLDVLYENSDKQCEDLLYTIHEKKTAALLKAAMLAGAYAAGASDEECQIIDKYASCIGLTFQITDDILDVVSDKETLGKTPGKDMDVGKLTFVSLYGIDKARELVDRYTREAIEAISRINADTGFFVWLAEYISDRKF
ncbi:MAG: polyprenyl synthetase family protein [Clostridiales bacterium]|nr:polyprenyl synthetase family protein [Clostridiales bacterium]